MIVVETAGRADLAQVFVLELRPGAKWRVECVGAVDPHVPRQEKVVLVVSSQYGCPVGCAMCDAGSWYSGNLTADEIRAQIRHLVEAWAGVAAATDCPKFKVQFARMGEPALNDDVLEVIDNLSDLIATPGLIACVATTAPRSSASWLQRLAALRERRYGPDGFQLQFSVQTTDDRLRDRLIPIATLGLREIGAFASWFVKPGDRKVTLNFALTQDVPVSAAVIASSFSPDSCVVKLTPLNPTASTRQNGLSTAFESAEDAGVHRLVSRIESYGFRCIVSVGEPEESAMGTSCGQLARLVRPVC
jgi:23S rRNA (adenine2503-C2)-methyltransferase